MWMNKYICDCAMKVNRFYWRSSSAYWTPICFCLVSNFWAVSYLQNTFSSSAQMQRLSPTNKPANRPSPFSHIPTGTCRNRRKSKKNIPIPTALLLHHTHNTHNSSPKSVTIYALVCSPVKRSASVQFFCVLARNRVQPVAEQHARENPGYQIPPSVPIRAGWHGKKITPLSTARLRTPDDACGRM